MRKPTQIQINALKFMAQKVDRKTCGRELSGHGIGNVSTLHQLAERGLVKQSGYRHMHAAEYSDYVITSIGRRYLRSLAAADK